MVGITSKRKDPNTIFLRYTPAISSLTRHHLETICSDIGPVKKCSVIRKQKANNQRIASGFAFIKFTTEEDAKEAVSQLHKKYIFLEEDTGTLSMEKKKQTNGYTSIQFMVDLTTSDNNHKEHPKEDDHDDNRYHESESESESRSQSEPTLTHAHDELLTKQKRTNRIIVRNLSFYAKIQDIQTSMEDAFGKVVDVHLPLVPTGNQNQTQSDKQRKFRTTHRGFAFVTFENVIHAKKAVECKHLMIKKRRVTMDYSISKFHHQQIQKDETILNEKNTEMSEVTNEKGDDSNDESSSDSDGDSNSNSNSNDESDNSDSDSDSDSNSDIDSDNDNESKNTKKSQTNKSQDKPKVDAGVHQQRTLFVRNLPYDCSRHDLFQLFAPFGTISSIYLVKDRNTGMLKGTAFVEYQHSNFAKAAIQASGSGSIHESSSTENTSNMSSLYLQGRRLFLNYAVDKETAATMTADANQKKMGKDKRNLYLKNEGRVTDEDGWEDELLDLDREKRGRAHNEKSQKLRSPLFFINPFRISVRNLAKHIQDESQLRTLIVDGLEKGLTRNLVSKEDIWLHLRAKGDDIPRSKMLDLEIPNFDPKQIKESIPSIYIDKDKITSTSKGFAFVEFTHHAHALACLRQLNNNPYYSKDYVTGGKKSANTSKSSSSSSSSSKVPRLIVEFTVENKAKAKLQADRRERQLQNAKQQKQNKLSKDKLKLKLKLQPNKQVHDPKNKQSKKKSRGAIQREKKRKRKAEVENGNGNGNGNSSESKNDETLITKESNKAKDKSMKTKMIKPPKKRKSDKEEEAFESMVQSYKSKFMGSMKSKNTNKNQSDGGKNKERENISKSRWFD